MDTEGGTLPVNTGYVGKRLGGTEIVFSYQTFNSLPSKGTAVNEGGQAERFDTDVKVPSEIRLDGKAYPQERLLLAASLRLIASRQASGSMDDLVFGADALPAHLEQDNHLEIDFGGLLKPQSWVGFVGSIHWKQASFRSDDDASIEIANLGGMAIDVGAITYADIGQACFNLGYQVPTKFEYLTAGNGQETWPGSSQSVEMQNFGWNIKLGLSLYF
jgi:hypothetical protein